MSPLVPNRKPPRSAATGEPLAALRGDTAGVSSVAFGPHGTELATAGKDHLVKLRDVARRTFQEHEHHVTTVAFSPDGALLASASLDGTVKLWEVATGEAIHTLRGHADCSKGLLRRH